MAVDPKNGHLFVLEGHNQEIYDYGPGANGTFDGNTGDDTVTHFDLYRYGVIDPDGEGLAYDAERDTLLMLDSASKSVYELSTAGDLLNVVNVSAAKPHSAAGVTMAPASDGSGHLNAYISDRNVDNDTDSSENDGRFTEVDLHLPAVGATNKHPTGGERRG